MGEQFSEKDRAFINDAVGDVNVPYGEEVIIKRYLGISDAGNPAKGIQPKFSFNKIRTRAIITQIDQKDLLFSGGLYQIGDITATLRESLSFVDNKNNENQNDRLVYRGHEYRIVGLKDPETLIDRDKVHIYIFRKVGNL